MFFEGENRDKPLHNDSRDTLNFIFELTYRKVENLRHCGYSIVEIWECDFCKQLCDSKEMRAYI